ncbi:MMPL family transporter [Streptomyces beigongshangae]|uniref:MMPL family transporter n=1 Tax=Streptomyces beigongshangae TaxID=2841597 RepID=UPI001C8446AE|nr:MMPL family transporter [Streptomyces sp. REN17]
MSAGNISSALGFALAVDYHLCLLARHREETAKGATTDAALRTAMRTAGRAVALSAGTVTLSPSALLVIPHTILRSIAYGGIAVTVFAALGILVVLPALVAVLGDRIERFGVPGQRPPPRLVGRAGVVGAHGPDRHAAPGSRGPRRHRRAAPPLRPPRLPSDVRPPATAGPADTELPRK